MRTREFTTRLRLVELLFSIIVISVPTLIFIKADLFIRIVLVVAWSLYAVLDSSQLVLSSIGIEKIYPFNPLRKGILVKWGETKKVSIHFRNGLTHGAMMPSYIELILKSGSRRRINLKLKEEELKTLIEMAEENRVDARVINNPYSFRTDL